MASNNLPIAYQELCTSYHHIDDFRGKLLGFLPVATGAGLLFVAKDNPTLLEKQPMAIGAFGLVVALGLFMYEIYGIKKCAELIKRGKQIERLLGFEGQFRGRPQAVLWVIAEPLAAGLIYPAVIASWLFLMFHCTQTTAWFVSGSAFGVLSAWVVVWARLLARSGEKTQTCVACGTGLEHSESTPTRMRSVRSFKDYLLCDRCYEAVNSWLSTRRPALTKQPSAEISTASS